MSLKEYTKAIQDARRVIAIRPKWAKGHSRLAAAHFALQDYSEVLLLDQEQQHSTDVQAGKWTWYNFCML